MPKARTAPVLNTGFCEYCGDVLVQRPDELTHNWIKRRNCNMRHAMLQLQKRRKERMLTTEKKDELLGVKRYQKGTPEFEAIAALYQ